MNPTWVTAWFTHQHRIPGAGGREVRLGRSRIDHELLTTSQHHAHSIESPRAFFEQTSTLGHQPTPANTPSVESPLPHQPSLAWNVSDLRLASQRAKARLSYPD